MNCPNCGGNIVGDGFTTPRHCENSDIIELCLEPDADVHYCTEEGESENFM